MGCLEIERMLLAAPRIQSTTQRIHIVRCPSCSRLAVAAEAFDRELEKTLFVPVPDSLPDRLLLAREWSHRTRGKRLIAAALLVGITAAIATEMRTPPRELPTLGAKHPAVAAIAEAVRERDRAAPAAPRASAYDDVRHAGLDLPPDEARAEYVGECHLAGSARCEHIIVTTRADQANVMLAPDLPAMKRLLVSDQRMVALMNPARTGTFIVVAGSADAAKRVEKLLLRSSSAPHTPIDASAP